MENDQTRSEFTKISDDELIEWAIERSKLNKTSYIIIIGVVLLLVSTVSFFIF